MKFLKMTKLRGCICNYYNGNLVNIHLFYVNKWLLLNEPTIIDSIKGIDNSILPPSIKNNDLILCTVYYDKCNNNITLYTDDKIHVLRLLCIENCYYIINEWPVYYENCNSESIKDESISINDTVYDFVYDACVNISCIDIINKNTDASSIFVDKDCMNLATNVRGRINFKYHDEDCSIKLYSSDILDIIYNYTDKLYLYQALNILSKCAFAILED